MPDASVGALPAEDRERSPLTGWTRAHWERVADVLLDGVSRHASRSHAFIFVPDARGAARRRPSAGLEGFARTFLLAAYRLASPSGAVPGDPAGRYAEGLVSGTDPGSRERWPAIRDTSQPLVEAAFVALALHESRRSIWERLSGLEQARIVDWLAAVRGKKVWHNNWRLFPVIVNAFLKSVGGPHRQEEIERNLDTVDSWYRRDGWYADGPGANYDYYVGWAIHFLTLMWCRMDGDRSAPARARIYRERAARYLEQYRFLFAANGAPLYHGRSLTYRVATAAPLWAGALLDASPLAPGETRRIASGVLRHFVDRGAIEHGLLTRGWYGEFRPMLQHYSGHGSQYWASIGFLGLVLAPEHAVWAAREEPMAVERDDFCVAMPEPGFVVRGTRADGIVRAASHRSDHYPLPLAGRMKLRRAGPIMWQVIRRGHRSPGAGPDDAHYRKLAYSTHSAPEVGRKGDDRDVDSQVALLWPRGTVSRRAKLHPIAAIDRFAASAFYPNEPDWADRVETVSLARGAAEIRIHHVTARERVRVRDGGFAIADETPLEIAAGEVWSLASRRDGLTALMGALYGFDGSGVERSEGTNPFGRHSATPYLTASAPACPEAIYVSLVVQAGRRVLPQEAMADVLRVEVSGRQVLVHCRDGERFFVQMVAPEPVDRELGPLRLRGAVRFARVSPDGTSFIRCE
jgi:hypothetical protein